jgi:broad specificity phosphatase PhoE
LHGIYGAVAEVSEVGNGLNAEWRLVSHRSHSDLTDLTDLTDQLTMRATRIALLLLPLGALPVLKHPILQAPDANPVTVFLVRHAEKATDDPRDPTLTNAGRERVRELARILADAGVTSFFATEYKRTQLTVDPLARAAGSQATVIAASEMDSLVARLQTLPPGSRAVVASHSNLVHLIVMRLTGATVKPLEDADYDRLYVLTLTGKGTGAAVVLRYGSR